ncbi:hypothetical protein [Streptosporangium sp. NPDC000396]|uniref:hypothetical protein n=1 Tax=Streptosporangium sp. NPDC000396 TaxID=3366185 RepID=UPI0036BBD543
MLDMHTERSTSRRALSTAYIVEGWRADVAFETATIAALGGERMVDTYYGLYNTLSGIGVAAGNLLSGGGA